MRFVFVGPEPDKVLRFAIKRQISKGSMCKRYGRKTARLESMGEPLEIHKPKPTGPSRDEILQKLEELKAEKKKLFEMIRNSSAKRLKEK